MLPTCYILIGLPGSGKSTLAQQLLSYRPNYRIVSPDRIRKQLYGNPSIQGDWPTIEQHVIAQIQQSLLARTPIIYDATNYNRHHRIDLIQKLSALPSAQWIGLYLKTPLDQCKTWNQQRNRQVPEAIIDIMKQSLTAYPPNLKEGFTRIYEIPSDLAELFKEFT
jgi:predicted kinase